MKTAVAIALYNGEKFILKQMESIRTQTQQPDHVVFCDDGSRDHTIAIVQNYIAEHHLSDTWQIFKNETNLGYARNFFKAMSLCHADLIFLADQDDIWKPDKIEKMTAIMHDNPHIQLLSCKYEIMDANDQIMHGVLARPPKNTGSLRAISNKDLLRGFYWLGMLMCVRRDFLCELLPIAQTLFIAHDRILSHCAADRGVFYEYDYTGAYHRRHDNNTEREEHRISKLLNRSNKLKEIEIITTLWSDMLSARLPLSENSRLQIKERIMLSRKRYDALLYRRLDKLIALYWQDGRNYLRLVSFLSDAWLVCFGK